MQGAGRAGRRAYRAQGLQGLQGTGVQGVQAQKCQTEILHLQSVYARARWGEVVQGVYRACKAQACRACRACRCKNARLKSYICSPYARAMWEEVVQGVQGLQGAGVQGVQARKCQTEILHLQSLCSGYVGGGGAGLAGQRFKHCSEASFLGRTLQRTSWAELCSQLPGPNFAANFPGRTLKLTSWVECSDALCIPGGQAS